MLTLQCGLVSRDMEEYKAASYRLRTDIKDAKLRYRDRVESQFQQHDSKSMWQGLWTITEYRYRRSPIVSTNTALVEELNAFYA